ncbi:hypothetical protein D3C87_1069810 [compost metagenome]
MKSNTPREVDENAPLQRRKITASTRGGYRPNSGRKPNSMNRFSMEAREKAMATGMLPHEFLLAVARGERITRWVPHPNPDLAAAGEVVQVEEKYEFAQRLDAAKAGAPYFAPRISAVEVIKGTPDHELDAIIAELAAKAGLDIGASGEAAQDGAGDDPAD